MSAPLSRLVVGLALAAGATVLFAPQAAAVAGGLLLGFVLPGVALLEVLFGRRALTPVERTVLAPALSMGALIVIGLGLHVAGLRIDRLAWTAATVGVTLVAVAAARLLRGRAPDAAPQSRPAGEMPVPPDVADPTVPLPVVPGFDDPTIPLTVPPRFDDPTIPLTVPEHFGDPAIPLSTPVHGMAEANTVVLAVVPAVLEEDERGAAAREKSRRRRLRWQFLPLALVTMVLAGASWLSFDTSRATHDTAVTELSATPPGPVDAAGNRTVRVSATGLLAGDGPYTVRVTGPSGATTVKRTVAVTGAGTWSEALSVPGAQRMTVSLFRSGDTTAYRTLILSAVD